MALNLANLVYTPINSLAYAYEHYRRWKYTTSDNLSTVLAGGYFNGADPMVRQDDIIGVIGGDGNCVVFVTGMSAGGVTVTKQANVSTFETGW